MDPSAPNGDTVTGVTETVVLVVRGRSHAVRYHAGDTVLEAARRAKVSTPYSCEAGNCATCMAMLRDGSVTMRANEALDEDDVAEGWVLTCQSIPTSPSVTVEWDSY